MSGNPSHFFIMRMGKIKHFNIVVCKDNCCNKNSPWGYLYF